MTALIFQINRVHWTGCALNKDCVEQGSTERNKEDSIVSASIPGDEPGLGQ